MWITISLIGWKTFIYWIGTLHSIKKILFSNIIQPMEHVSNLQIKGNLVIWFNERLRYSVELYTELHNELCVNSPWCLINKFITLSLCRYRSDCLKDHRKRKRHTVHHSKDLMCTEREFRIVHFFEVTASSVS